ncbi:MAG: hypothetical protein LKE37_06735 [Atopobiaceae bacterium]|jgi:hypothetical protein|nr:hypothetical protein [Atopobiaceae bacterium]
MIGRMLRIWAVGEGDTTSPAERVRRHRRLHLDDVDDLAPWKRRMLRHWLLGTALVGAALIVFACLCLRDAVGDERAEWFDQSSPQVQSWLSTADRQAGEGNATRVTCGTYLSNISSIDIAGTDFNVTMQVWFRWQGDEALDMADHFTIYKGIINSQEVVRQESVGDTHYQLVRLNVDISKDFDTRRFPLDSHQLCIYVKSAYPASQVIFVPDVENSQVNGGLSTSGYDIGDETWGESAYVRESSDGAPGIEEHQAMSEFVTAVTITSKGFGTFFKCFVAMYATSLWVLIMLYICGKDRVDPLDMLPDALFGTVANVMIGAALLPDALSLGLLEFVNMWGVATVLMATLAVIQINNIRSDYGQADEAFAEFFGRGLFYVIAALTVVGNVALPLCALL